MASLGSALPEIGADEIVVDLSRGSTGSFGKVFKGELRQQGVRRPVACKSFHFIRITEMWDVCFGSDAVDGAASWARFLQDIHDELSAMARLRHPRCVHVQRQPWHHSTVVSLLSPGQGLRIRAKSILHAVGAGLWRLWVSFGQKQMRWRGPRVSARRNTS
jgi:hypothetical protein